MVFQIIIACVYAVALSAYFLIETKPRLFSLRAAVKVFLASAYVALAVVNTVFADSGPSEFKKIVCVACACAWLGDLFLLFRKTYGVGVAFFLLSNIAFIAAETGAAKEINSIPAFMCVAAAVFILVYGGLAAAQIVKFCDFGKYVVPLNAYVAAVTLNGSIGCALVFQQMGTLFTVFGVGVTLFMISDYLLGVYLFKLKSPKLLISNSAAYFTGMFLVAMSLYF